MSTNTSDEVESDKALQTSMSTQNDTNAVLDGDTVDNKSTSSQSVQEADTTSIAVENTPIDTTTDMDNNPSSTTIAKDEFEQRLTKKATSKSIEGLEQPMSDEPPSDPSIFDDSLEKKENENSRRGIEQLLSDNNNEGPALDPRIVHDDSLDKVREKEAAMNLPTTQTSSVYVQNHTNVQNQSRANVIHQGVNSTNTDDRNNNNSYNTLEQGINSEEQSQRDTLGRLSQTQRRQGANNNNYSLDINQGRGRRDEHITSTAHGRSLVGRIANSLFPRIYHDSETLVEATLVVEDDTIVMGEIVEARRVGFCARNWKGIGVVLLCILIIFAVLLSVSLATHNRRHSDEMEMMHEPSIQPSSPPSFDQRPTFDIVRERGNVRCGVSNGTITISGGRILHLVSASLSYMYLPCISSLWLTINFYHIFIRG